MIPVNIPNKVSSESKESELEIPPAMETITTPAGKGLIIAAFTKKYETLKISYLINLLLILANFNFAPKTWKIFEDYLL